MQHHPKYQRITVDSQMCFGKPCIRGYRMPVASLLDYLSSGMTTDELLKEFPFLEKEDISEALAFSAMIAGDSWIPFSKA